jgi:hypothetical protein
MIKFIEGKKEESEILTFEDVGEDQFFVDAVGNLCQKIDDFNYVTIADVDGHPFCTHELGEPEDEINRIIENVSKIEF